ncbi:MAG TPA: Wzz/FepE/Etk N-terminal domain-containing protein [Phototrophicaceae bacterium]|jgi:capsular polysaccharide biosynthesis protein|nr:Wzz/FepE/Etk N-terminal domain-containing protein [Phototrophicaceae bacterium]
MSDQSTLSPGKNNRSGVQESNNYQTDSADTAPVIPVELEASKIENGMADMTIDKTELASNPIPAARRTAEVQTPALVPPPSAYTDIVSFLRVLVVNSWIIILLGALGAGGAYLYAKSQPKVYQSTTSLIVVPLVSDDVGNQVNVINALKVNLVGTYVQILLSRDHTVEPAYTLLAKKYDEKLINQAFIDVVPVANSTVITISVDSTDPQLAQEMADTLADQAIQNSPKQFAGIYPMEILDRASDPGDPIAPQTRLVVIMGGAGAAVIGVALAFFLDSYIRFRRSTQNSVKKS